MADWTALKGYNAGARNIVALVRILMRRAFIVGLLVLACWAGAQKTEPDEVQVSSRPYPPPANLPVFHANTKLVDVSVVVRDENGHAMGGLKQADFQVLEDGKRRRVTAFSAEQSPAAVSLAGTKPAPQTSPPGIPLPATRAAAISPLRSIALLFDDIHTRPGDLAAAKLAARQFLASVAPGDRIALFTTSSTQTLDFTSDRDKVLAMVAKMEAHPLGSEKGTQACSEMSPYQAYLIANDLDMGAVIAVLEDECTCSGKSVEVCSMIGSQMTDAHFSSTDADVVAVEMQAEQMWQRTKGLAQNTLASIRGVLSYLGRQPGKRMLVLASGGFMSETLERDTDALIDQAIRAGIVVNTLDVKGLRAKTEDRDASDEMHLGAQAAHAFLFNAVSTSARLDSLDAPLATLALGTGGLFFHNNNDLNLGFREIGGIPQTTYFLGFPPRTDGKYHKLKIKVRGRKGEFVEARPGYFAPTKQQEAASSAAPAPDPLQQAFALSNTMSQVPANFIVEAAGQSGGKPVLSIAVHVDLNGLKFRRQQDRQVQKLTFIAALLDAQGNVVAGKEGEMALALKDPTFAHLSKSGITARMFLQAPPGRYRLREVVQEANSGKVSASTEEVELPVNAAKVAASAMPAVTQPSFVSPPVLDQQTKQHLTPPSPKGESAESFLRRAQDQAREYIEQFADLTGEEHRKIELFDERGVPTMSRTMVSALVVYRLQSDQSRTVEYRDVEVVDGKPIRDHARRAVKIWSELSALRSPNQEEERIVHESERYDIGFAASGFTLFQGLPLGVWCQGAFQLQERGSEVVNRRQTRIFSYRQVRPCDQVHYALALPPAFRGTVRQSGRLWLDAKTAQLVREDRNVEVGTGAQKWRAVHFRFDYADSNFGLLLPAAIHSEMYTPQMRGGVIVSSPMRARLGQTYGPFSRFEVHVEQKAAMRAKSH